MSTPKPKVFLTYKRKRLPSRSGEMNVDTMKSSEKDPMGKALGENGSTEATLQETTKFSCLDLDSNFGLIDGCNGSGLVSQPEEDPNSLSKPKSTSTLDVSAKSPASLFTFRRRLKRQDVGSSAISGELLAKEGAVDVGESEAIDDVKSKGEVTSKESRDSSGLSTRSSADVPALGQTVEKDCSQDDLVVDRSSVTKQSVSALSGSDAVEGTNLPKNIVLLSSDGENSSCDDICKTDDQHVANQCLTSSGDSQLTSHDCSGVKSFAEKAVQHTASSALDLSGPSSDAFVIDCNAIPKSDHQEKEPTTAQNSSALAESRGKATVVGDLQVADMLSTDVVELGSNLLLLASVAAEKKSEIKCLQLFSEAGPSSQMAPSTTNLESGSWRPQQNASHPLHRDMGQLEQVSRKAPVAVSLSLAMESIYEGQTSHGSYMRIFQDHNVSIREFIQNPAAQSFPDQPLLDTGNTRAAALMGNQNISLDMFPPSRTRWSEEELDSLWIGVRRHGRGNWHAMLLDPRLRFAPWRVARDLAAQWEQEEPIFLSKQQNLQERRDPRVPRENPLTKTVLSLGDLYARREGSYFRPNGQKQSPMHTALPNRSGNYNINLFNNMHTSVTLGGDRIGLGLSNPLPHWLREPTGTTSMTSAMPQTGGPRFVQPLADPSGPSSGVRNLNNYRFPGTMPGQIHPSGGLNYGFSVPCSRNPSPAENLIILDDSDASSEETISDEHIARN